MISTTTPNPHRATVAPAAETVLWHGNPSRWNYLGPGVWGVLLLPFGVGLFILLGAYLRRRSLRYAVTTDKLVVRYGLFVVSSRELRIRDVRSINIYRRGLSGLSGLGTIEFSSAAHDSASVFFHGILAAEAVADTVRAVQAGGAPTPLAGSLETESNAAAVLHFAGLALVPILCAVFLGLRVRDTMQEVPAGDLNTPMTAPVAQAPDLGSSTTLLPTPVLSDPSALPAAGQYGPPGRGTNAQAAVPRATRKPVNSPAALARAVAASKARALKLYPSLGTAGSRLNSAFVARYEQLSREHSERLQDPDWPERVAAECAARSPAAAR